jgi:phenylacetate-CoA ligase
MSLDTLYRRSPIWAQNLFLNAYAFQLARYRQGTAYRAMLARLLESQWSSREQLDAYRDERIRAVVRTAFERSTFYRRLFRDAGLTPDDIRGAQDLSKLPLLTKDVVRSHGAELLTANGPARDWRHGHTSGTTGSPLSLWYDRMTCVVNDAADRRQKLWGGMKDGDWIGVLLGRVIVPIDEEHPPFWRVNRVHRQIWFSSFHMKEENLDLFVAEMRHRRLRFLEGYPSTLFILAQHLIRRGQELPMTAVFTSSETLHAVQRETIEAAFGCRPYDFYGHAERAIFATECEHHDGKHLAEEYGYTEVVDGEGRAVPDGEPGYLVGTSLHNMAMPMIRYRAGDVSRILREPCACGRTLRRIAGVTTKAEDIIVTPDGRMISPSVLTHPFKPFPQILKSQLVQDRYDHVLVKIVPSNDFTPGDQQVLISEIAMRLGPGVKVDVQLVDDIPAEASGKFRWIISRVRHPAHFAWS